MKRVSIISYLMILPVILFPGIAIAGSATITWQENFEPDIAGYRVYWGTSAGGPYGSFTDLISGQASFTITGLDPGTYYFVVTAVDTSGNASAYSTEVSKVKIKRQGQP